MVLMKFQRPAFYVRKDPDAGWIVSIWKWRLFFNVHRRRGAR